MEETDSPRLIRFGTFEVDVRAQELRKSGLRVKLTGQPFQVLAILLEHAGQVVTREELQKRLWPDTFVDVDHNLNTAINKIREALGDSAENPRFVETLPRRGYRFIGTLTYTREPRMPDSAENDAKSSTATGARLTATPPDRPKITGASLRSAALALTGAFLGSMALLGYALKPWPPPKVLGSRQLTYDSQQKTASYVGELASPLVSDGTRLFFTECAGRPRLTEVSTGGGETTSFPADLHIRRVLDISAERHELLALVYDGVQMDTAAIVVPLPAGTPHRLGDVLAHDGSWSPDGTRLVYAFANSLYMSARDGSEPRKLTEISGGSAAFAKQGDE